MARLKLWAHTDSICDDPALVSGIIDAEVCIVDPQGERLGANEVGEVLVRTKRAMADRLKDMYITNGYNVYPAEIERMICGIPDIQQCAIIGVPDARKGEVGHAFLVRAPGSSPTEMEIMTWCKDNMANYKIPKCVTFVDDLPRNSLGKILKRELKSRL